MPGPQDDEEGVRNFGGALLPLWEKSPGMSVLTLFIDPTHLVPHFLPSRRHYLPRCSLRIFSESFAQDADVI